MAAAGVERMQPAPGKRAARRRGAGARSASCDEVDQPVGHNDHLARRLALEQADNLVRSKRQLLERLPRRSLGCGQRVAELAVDLDRRLSPRRPPAASGSTSGQAASATRPSLAELSPHASSATGGGSSVPTSRMAAPRTAADAGSAEGATFSRALPTRLVELGDRLVELPAPRCRRATPCDGAVAEPAVDVRIGCRARRHVSRRCTGRSAATPAGRSATRLRCRRGSIPGPAPAGCRRA